MEAQKDEFLRSVEDPEKKILLHQSLQDELSEELLKTGVALKESALAFGSQLEIDREVSEKAHESIENNANQISSAAKKLEDYRKRQALGVFYIYGAYLALIGLFVLGLLVILQFSKSPQTQKVYTTVTQAQTVYETRFGSDIMMSNSIQTNTIVTDIINLNTTETDSVETNTETQIQTKVLTDTLEPQHDEL
ncbi:hypothetical protein CANCADRAFT_43315 [Tortispora caseinolytica NRRL Y-17796]|uniref:t-SNARE coiled-coil homology domain-containing protein n=1 Tax=Tortispora caseinolytica NRRL Y-17796 TaxID=767744 RepID=A0A1E4TLV2_9ASCO|nr:hypothetical protein CANCADRAFT_43315 [Tortispora caseinolytica NRRL Y-17796]